MTGRVALRVTCKKGSHSPAVVVATSDGYMVNVDLAVQNGYGQRFDIQKNALRLDGPIGDPQSWATQVGCLCGTAYLLTDFEIRGAISAGVRVLRLSAPLPHFGPVRTSPTE